MAGCNYLVVASMDFGTTYSGWAFSFRHQYEKDPSKVYAMKWNSGEHFSPKTPTTLLIKPDGKTLRAFGYDAEDIYTEMETEEERQSHYFFRRFKMMLFNNQHISRDMELKDANGKTLPAILVFQLAIEYLKNGLLRECGSRLSGLDERDVHWCLTVPAIWNDKAKNFMREAAIKAGINSCDLTIVLEPEAASVFCQHLPVDQLEGGSVAVMTPGSTYMVVDCGGGTTDICCHEILEDNKLRETHRASGGAVGGTHVDDAFESLLVKIFGRDVWETFSRQYKGDVVLLFRSFEVRKRDIAETEGEPVTFSLPMALGDLLRNQDVQSNLSNAGFEDVVRFIKNRNKLRINRKFLRDQTFADMVKALQDLLLEVCTNPMVEETKKVLLVGGLSESPVIRDAVRKTLPGKQVITVPEPSLVVVKGAVVYGHDDSVIRSRIARYTYGIAKCETFDPAVHDEHMSYINNRGSRRIRLFKTIISAGQELPCTARRISRPDHIDQSQVFVRMYAVDAEEDIPIYIKDPRCIFLGKVTAPITNTAVPLKDRRFAREFIFGGTEISAFVTEMTTGITTEGCVDFLG